MMKLPFGYELWFLDKSVILTKNRIEKEMEKIYGNDAAIERIVSQNTHYITGSVREIMTDNIDFLRKSILRAMTEDGFQKRIAGIVEDELKHRVMCSLDRD